LPERAIEDFACAGEDQQRLCGKLTVMNTSSLYLVKLLASLCVGAALLAGCSSSSSGSVYVPSAKKCDPTGDSEARRACNN